MAYRSRKQEGGWKVKLRHIPYHCLVIVVSLLGLSSCDYELCYDHPHTADIKVVFDWRKAPDASPQSMSLYLFPASGGDPLRYEFTDITGGIIKVPEGLYHAACINSDTELVLYRNTGSPETFECYTRSTALLENYSSYGVRSETVPRAESTGDERVSLSPDMLWSDRAEDVTVTKGSDNTLILYPGESVCTYTVTVRNAENLKYAAALGGSLSTMAGGVLPAVDRVGAESVTVPFDAYKSQDKTTLYARFLTFGQPDSRECQHTLIIYAILSDNAKWYYTYNVTEQVHDAPDPHHVDIVLDGLPLPKPIENGNGFKPDIDEWQTVKIDISL